MLLSGGGTLSSGPGIRSLVVSAKCSFLTKKLANGRFTKKTKRLVHSLIFGERPEQITHGHSFLVSDLSDSLTSLIKKEEMSESLIKNVQKTYQTYDFTILVALLT